MIGAYGSHAIDTVRWLFRSEVARCGGISRIETESRMDRNGVTQASTAEDAFTAWFVMENGGSVSFDTAFSTAVGLPHRLILIGSDGALELIDERTIVWRRPNAEPETIEYPPPPGDPHDAGLVPWLTEVRAALRSGRPSAPSFDDGAAVAEVVQTLRDTLIRAPGVLQHKQLASV